MVGDGPVARMREGLGGLLLNSLNFAAAVEDRIRPPPGLDPAELVAEARASGFQDLGDDGFEAGLTSLFAACQREAHLSPLGTRMLRSECLRLLRNRGAMAEMWRRFPETLETAIPDPVFIVGFPRTGTTLLHNLLSNAPGHRAPTLAEVTDPVNSLRGDGARRRARRTIRWLNTTNPRLRRIHELRADAPEECTFLLQPTFRSVLFGTAMNVPSYVAWLLRQDMRPVYEYHRMQLQLLSARKPPSVWVLKSPAHLFALEALCAVYPNARIIHTHRDVEKVVGSLCSLREVLRSITSRSIDLERTGRYTLLALRAFVAKAMSARRKLAADRFMDVRFDELVTAPDEVCLRIWRFLQAADADANVAHGLEWLTRHPISRRPTHSYDVTRYGLDRGEVEAQLGEYRAWFEGLTAPTNH